jgi:hypothetical protein
MKSTTVKLNLKKVQEVKWSKFRNGNGDGGSAHLCCVLMLLFSTAAAK